jgi:protein MpaA
MVPSLSHAMDGKWRALLIALPVLLVGCVATGTAMAKGVGQMVAPGGVTLDGSPYRYTALSPRTSHRLTVVARTDRDDGRVSRWWSLPGSYSVPAVAYDGSGGGLSADGSTLVLSRFSRTYSPPRSRFAILNTRVHLRHPERSGEHRPHHAIARVDLRGDFSFDAISPDGSVVYLIHHLPSHTGPDYIANYEVRALDTASGELLPRPIVDPSEPDERMGGLPITRASSPDGRWAYTLYDGNGGEPFIHALDTVARRAICVDLPQLEDRRNLFMLRLRIENAGRELVVLSRPAVIPSRPPRPGNPEVLATVDTDGLEVRREPVATASGWGMLDWLWAKRRQPAKGFLDFTQTPRRPGNLLARSGLAGRSAAGRPIGLLQRGDPAREGEVLVFGCIHGNECAARGIEPLAPAAGCPDPASDIYLVRNLNPDGFALGTRLDGRGVDLNRNFAADWRPIGERGDPQYSGPRPFSEPETRLAARIVRRLQPEVTIWFHQRSGPQPLVRAWGQGAPAGRRFAHLAGIPFHLLPWMDGTAPNWQNHRFPGTSSFVVELPPGTLPQGLERRLADAVVRLARKVSKD